MARPLRIEFEGALYHITSRGNAGAKIFFTESSRQAFLDILGEVVKRYGWICHAYCLMTNHYHLLIETPNANLSRGMRHLNGVYTQWVNRHMKRTGHIFQGRFKSILVERESHLLELARYVVLNPVRAKMVRTPRDWRWSSYRATASQIDAPSFLTVSWILSQFDKNPKKASQQYRKFVRQGRGAEVWNQLQRGTLLGSEEFVGHLAPLLDEHSASTEIPRNQRLAARPSLENLFADVADKRSRDERICQAIRKYEYLLREVAAYTGLHYSTISVIAQREENSNIKT
jgi:putative transposase